MEKQQFFIAPNGKDVSDFVKTYYEPEHFKELTPLLFYPKPAERLAVVRKDLPNSPVSISTFSTNTRDKIDNEELVKFVNEFKTGDLFIVDMVSLNKVWNLNTQKPVDGNRFSIIPSKEISFDGGSYFFFSNKTVGRLYAMAHKHVLALALFYAKTLLLGGNYPRSVGVKLLTELVGVFYEYNFPRIYQDEHLKDAVGTLEDGWGRVFDFDKEQYEDFTRAVTEQNGKPKFTVSYINEKRKIPYSSVSKDIKIDVKVPRGVRALYVSFGDLYVEYIQTEDEKENKEILDGIWGWLLQGLGLEDRNIIVMALDKKEE